METHGIIESFADLEDAFQFIDHKILEFVSQGWQLSGGSGVSYVNLQWRVGLLLTRGKEDNVEQ